MNREHEKQVLEERLERCRELALQFPTGATADLIRELEADLREQLLALQKNKAAS